MDEEAKRREGLTLAREIFVPMDRPGIPVTHRIVLKPNYAGNGRAVLRRRGHGPEGSWPKKFYFVEANSYPVWNHRGFVDINERLGVQMNEPERRPRHFRENWEMNWSTVPDAVVYKRIPHYAPVNEPDTWLLNIAKWKVSRHVPDPVGQERARAGGAPLRSLLLRLEHGDGSARFHEAGHSSQRGSR